MKRSTHSDRIAAWAGKQNTSGYKTKTTISKTDLLRHKALELDSIDEDELNDNKVK